MRNVSLTCEHSRSGYDAHNAQDKKKVGVTEEERLLCSTKRKKMTWYGYLKRRPESLELGSIEGELPMKPKELEG